MDKNSDKKHKKLILKKNRFAIDKKRELRVILTDVIPKKKKKEESLATLARQQKAADPRVCKEESSDEENAQVDLKEKATVEKSKTTITTDEVSDPKTLKQEQTQAIRTRPELKVSLPVEIYNSAMKKREMAKVTEEKSNPKYVDNETTTDKNEDLPKSPPQTDMIVEAIVQRFKREDIFVSFKNEVIEVIKNTLMAVVEKQNEKIDLILNFMTKNNNQTVNVNFGPNNNNRITHEEPMRVAEEENKNVTNNEIGNNTEVENVINATNKPIEDDSNNISVMPQSTENKNDKDNDEENIEDDSNVAIPVMPQGTENKNDKDNDEEKIENNATNSNEKTNESNNAQNLEESGANLMDAVKEISDMNKTILKTMIDNVPMLENSNIKVSSILPETPIKLQRIRHRRQTFTPGMPLNLSAPTRRPSMESLEQEYTTQNESSLFGKSFPKHLSGTQREDATHSGVPEDLTPLPPSETPRKAKKIMPRRMTVSTSHPLNLSSLPESPLMDAVYEGLLAIHSDHPLTQYPISQDGESQAIMQQVQSQQAPPKVPSPVPATPTMAKRIIPRRKSIATSHPLFSSKHYEECDYSTLESQSTIVVEDSNSQRTKSSEERNIARRLINSNSRRLSMVATESLDDQADKLKRKPLFKYVRSSSVKEEDNPLSAISILAADINNRPTVANTGAPRLPTSTQSGNNDLTQMLGCLQTGMSLDYSQEPAPENAAQQNAMENANTLAMDTPRAANEQLGLFNQVNFEPSITIERVQRKINAADPRTRSAHKRNLRSSATNPENQMLFSKKPMYSSDYSATVGSQPNPVASQMYSNTNPTPINIQTSSADIAPQNTMYSIAHMQRFPPPPLPPQFDHQSMANAGAVAYSQHAHNPQQYAVAGMPYAHNMGGMYNPQPVNAPYSSGYGHSMNMPAESSRYTTRNTNNAGMMEKSSTVGYPQNMQYTSALYDPEMPRVNQSPTNSNQMGYYQNMPMLYSSSASPNINTQPPGRPSNAQVSQAGATRIQRRTRSKR